MSDAPQGSLESYRNLFWIKVERRGPDECWPWKPNPGSGGYGVYGKPAKGAHVVAYELTVGPVPEGLELDHRCHDPETCPGGNGCPHRRCCNPAHLLPVTRQENVLRSRSVSAINAARERCENDHPLSGENLHIYPDGRRGCRRCARERMRRYRASQ